MKCPVCGFTKLTTTHEPYKYDESGLPNVTLLNLEIRRCGNCDEELAAIPRMAELHRAMARAVVHTACKLSGAEVSFLRKYLGHSEAEFTMLLGVDLEALSRWEGDEEPIGGTADRLLRLLVVHEKQIHNYDVAQQFSRIDEPCRPKPQALSFTYEGEDWHSTEG